MLCYVPPNGSEFSDCGVTKDYETSISQATTAQSPRYSETHRREEQCCCSRSQVPIKASNTFEISCNDYGASCSVECHLAEQLVTVHQVLIPVRYKHLSNELF